MAGNGVVENHREFRGYIKFDKAGKGIETNIAKDEDNEEGKESSFDSEEMEAMLEGATPISSRKIPFCTVTLRSLEPRSKDTRRVQGNFMYIDPWWEYTVCLKPADGRYHVGHEEMEREPQYSIRSDDRLDHGNKRSVLCQFIHKCITTISKDKKKCKEMKKLVPKFMDYLRDQAKEREVNRDFSLLRDIIDSASDIEDNTTRTLVGKVRKILLLSVHYHVLVNAMDCPTVLKVLPLVLHKSLPSLLESASHRNMLKLEEVVTTEPHLLGFQRAIQAKTDLQLPEVKYHEFESAGFLQDMIKEHRDALYVYCALKEKIKQDKDTYSWLYYWKKGLKRYVDGTWSSNERQYWSKGYKVTDWNVVLNFLKNDVEVICIDEKIIELIDADFKKDKRIFIWKYYWAEKYIAERMKEVMNTEQVFATCCSCENCKCGMCRQCLEKQEGSDEEGSDQGQDNEDVSTLSEDVSTQKQDQNCSKVDKDSPKGVGWSDDEDFEDGQKPLPLHVDSKKLVKKKNKKNYFVMDDDDDDYDGGGGGFLGNLNGDDDVSSANEGVPNSCEQELRKRQAEHDERQFGNDADQKAAAKAIRKNPFTLIIGRGGCGKTTVVCETLKQFCGASIVLAAPTGKAASNLRKKVKNYGKNMVAKTIHQITYTRALARSTETLWEFRDTEILVVDECSMVSVVLLSQVLNALMTGANLKKVILMGDYRQLPSIDSGNLLKDLYDHFKDQDDVCVELKTNHRTESEHIVNCAIQISNQEMPDLDAPEFRLEKLPKTDAAKKRVLHKLVKKDPMIKDHTKSQIVAFTKDDREDLNKWCCPLYANHNVKTRDWKYQFLEGDKICPTRNANVTDIPEMIKYKATLAGEERKKQREREEQGEEDSDDEDGRKKKKKKAPPPYMKRICNGEIFYIEKVEVKEERGKFVEEVTLTDLDETLTVPMSELRNLSNIRHAWARTIHTYQGSESDVVVYWLGSSYNQDWQHVYTAVTRGRYQVIIIGTTDNLRKAISREPKTRDTVLQERLHESLNLTNLMEKTGDGETSGHGKSGEISNTCQVKKDELGTSNCMHPHNAKKSDLSEYVVPKAQILKQTKPKIFERFTPMKGEVTQQKGHSIPQKGPLTPMKVQYQSSLVLPSTSTSGTPRMLQPKKNKIPETHTSPKQIPFTCVKSPIQMKNHQGTKSSKDNNTASSCSPRQKFSFKKQAKKRSYEMPSTSEHSSPLSDSRLYGIPTDGPGCSSPKQMKVNGTDPGGSDAEHKNNTGNNLNFSSKKTFPSEADTDTTRDRTPDRVGQSNKKVSSASNDVAVVDVSGDQDTTLLDNFTNPHSEQMSDDWSTQKWQILDDMEKEALNDLVKEDNLETEGKKKKEKKKRKKEKKNKKEKRSKKEKKHKKEKKSKEKYKDKSEKASCEHTNCAPCTVTSENVSSSTNAFGGNMSSISKTVWKNEIPSSSCQASTDERKDIREVDRTTDTTWATLEPGDMRVGNQKPQLLQKDPEFQLNIKGALVSNAASSEMTGHKLQERKNRLSRKKTQVRKAYQKQDDESTRENHVLKEASNILLGSSGENRSSNKSVQSFQGCRENNPSLSPEMVLIIQPNASPFRLSFAKKRPNPNFESPHEQDPIPSKRKF